MIKSYLFFIVLTALSINVTASTSCKKFLNQQFEINHYDIFKFENFDFKGFLSNGFRNENFYEYFSGKVEGTKLLHKAWYGKSRSTRINNFQKSLKILGPKRFALVLDPGVNSRLRQFLNFSKNYLLEHPDSSPIKLRKAFSEDLGTVILYRGFTYEADSVSDYIEKRGMPSSFFGFKGEKYSPEENINHQIILQFLRGGPIEDSLQRVYGRSSYSSFHSFSLSYSRHKLLAEAFTAKPKKNKRGYLVEIEIPLLETIGEKDFTSLIVTLVNNSTSFIKANDRWFYMGQSGIELFVYGRIEPHWIRKYTEVKGAKGLQNAVKFMLPPFIFSY